jgi:hypothetical protein
MYSPTLSSPSALDRGGWSTIHPGGFTSEKDTRYPYEARWVLAPVRRGAENFAPTGIELWTVQPAHRLCYRGPLIDIDIVHVFVRST